MKTDRQSPPTPLQALQRLIDSAPFSSILTWKRVYCELAHSGLIGDDAKLVVDFALACKVFIAGQDRQLRTVYRVDASRLPGTLAMLSSWESSRSSRPARLGR